MPSSRARLDAAVAAGVAPEQVVLDPGLGFAKPGSDNWPLLAHLDRLTDLGRPVLVGASRKRFLGHLLAGPDGPAPPEARDAATAAVTALAAAAGAWCVRVHEVAGSADAVRVAAAWTAAERSGQEAAVAEADRIRVTGIRATGYHGVLDHERRDGQVFVADVVLHVDTREAAAADRLSATVDYAALAAEVRDVLAGEPADLIETVAERIAAVALDHPTVAAVDVVLHKPEAPVGVPVADVAIEVHRSREHLPAVPVPECPRGRPGAGRRGRARNLSRRPWWRRAAAARAGAGRRTGRRRTSRRRPHRCRRPHRSRRRSRSPWWCRSRGRWPSRCGSR